MKKRLTVLICCCLFLLANALQAQSGEEKRIKRAAEGKGAYSQEELVSFKSDLPYKQALEALSTLSKKYLKKPIVDPTPMTTPIGVEIQAMYWKDALELILRTNGLWYTEQEDYIQVSSMGGVIGGPVGAPGAAPLDSSGILSKMREVTISAIFLEINTAKLRESGVSFRIFRGRDLNLQVEFNGAANVSSNIFGITASPTSPKLAVNVDAALNIFESEQIGEVIARPQTTVRTGAKGRIQVGTDFSVKERDFSGNIIDRFYSTGIILDISPKIYRYGTTDFIDIGYHAERSSVTPGTVSTLINKTQAEGRKIVVNGEETYVGGLYSNEENRTREGIPFLKDLPWWVLGLRYVFGYDKVELARKELLVILKAEFVPTVEDRVKDYVKDRNTLEEKLKENREDMSKKLKSK